MLVLVAAVSLLAGPSAPPPVTEFAPRAEQNLKEADGGPGAEINGHAAGARQARVIHEGDDPSEGAQPTQQPTGTDVRGVPSALTCVTWPDGSVTQTFDPQSPPCIATWDVTAGNGGATAPGVTGDAVLVAVQAGSASDEVTAFVGFFNTRYQFYGRQIQIVEFDIASDSSTVEAQLAAAENAAATGAFAAKSLWYSNGSQDDVFGRVLAQREMITVGSEWVNDFVTSQEVASAGPFRWLYSPAIDRIQRNLAAFLCRTLPADGVAAHAGPEFLTRTRTFAVLVPQVEGRSRAYDVGPLLDGLAGCGVQASVHEYDSEYGTSSNRQLVLELRGRPVTSLVYFGHLFPLSGLMEEAAKLAYEPEWILPGSRMQSWAETALGGAPPSQKRHLFGLGTWNPRLPLAEEVAHRAYVSVRPGQHPPHLPVLVNGWYRELALLAAGLQQAGPNLTPETFAAGLRNTAFPNPGSGARPYYQAAVGFGAGDHEMMDDFGVWWFDPTTKSSYNQNLRGAYCRALDGRRLSLATGWPEGPIDLFDGDCR